LYVLIMVGKLTVYSGVWVDCSSEYICRSGISKICFNEQSINIRIWLRCPIYQWYYWFSRILDGSSKIVLVAYIKWQRLVEWQLMRPNQLRRFN